MSKARKSWRAEIEDANVGRPPHRKTIVLQHGLDIGARANAEKCKRRACRSADFASMVDQLIETGAMADAA